MSTLEYKLFYQRHQPHLQPPGATLFITFRLAGSILSEVLQELPAEAERMETQLERIVDPRDRALAAYAEQRRIFGKWDTALDAASTGPVWIGDPQVAALVPRVSTTGMARSML